jgi:hypothetical protein
MSIEVPFLSEQEIEQTALRLLRDAGVCKSSNFNGIVPVEKILEHHLNLSLDFDDLHGKLGVQMSGEEPEILGALWVESREVFIDQSLDPDENPKMEGRYRFTVGHEIGHWCLHREHILAGSKEDDLFGAVVHSGPSVVCRASNSREPIEWQADVFASKLLMPTQLVHFWWRELFSRSTPLIFEVFERDSNWTRPPLGWRGITNLPRGLSSRFDPSAVSYFFFKASRELAPRFGVSIQAMQLRLEGLGLLLLERPRQMSVADVHQGTKPLF